MIELDKNFWIKVQEQYLANVNPDSYSYTKTFICSCSVTFKNVWELNKNIRDVIRKLASDFLSQTNEYNDWNQNDFIRSPLLLFDHPTLRGGINYVQIRKDFIQWMINNSEN